jgi:hypothetical protein
VSHMEVLQQRPSSLIPLQIRASLNSHTSQKSLLLEWLTRVEGSISNAARLSEFVGRAFREESQLISQAILTCLCLVRRFVVVSIQR